MTMDEEADVRLTLEYVRELIKKDEPDVEIDTLEEEPGSGRGDNYTSMLYRVRAKGRKLTKTGEWANCERVIIYKVLPLSRENREAYKSELLFKNEVAFYTNVWPALNQLQADGKNVFRGVAKIYVARLDLIAMEDLREKGYVMVDRRKGLQLDHLKRVLKVLAGFHALSLTLRKTRPEEFERLTDPNGQGVQECLFRMENEDWYRQYYHVGTNNAIRMVSDGLPPQMEHKRTEVMDKLQAFLNKHEFFRTMTEIAATQGPLTVFCHGDCWTNNILFKDVSNGEDEEDIYLVDFQLSRVGSLALDLANLLYCCASGEIRRVHMEQLLQHYHFHLMSSLCTLNPKQAPKDPSVMWELLNEEMRRCGRFGLGLAVDILPISTCESEEAPDLYETPEISDKNKALRAPPRGGAECSQLMTDIVLDLLDNHAL
ncbi:uncharacterized protein LOC108630669 [Ceratina calcarata]|uniref:Uncharacterized protein LOC108630669 n=1 Tax=Ceratina calcarata TaxID=156304 RepID=A0AAJ7JBK4_9HYME|nr:uncharacterized protein LOC108630669 [Ceratina calcarata]